MRYTLAALVGFVAVQQAAACDTCWQNPEPFPAGPDNCDECPEELKGAGGLVDWSQAPAGNPNYLGIKGSDCQVGDGKGKRDFTLRGRTFGKDHGSSGSGGSPISGKCARGEVTQNSGPSFSHDSPLSMKKLNVACSHQADVQFNFHYDSGPYKGKTCSHTASLQPGDNPVDISQCGSANRVTCNLPPPPANPKTPPPEKCQIGFKQLHFDCRSCPPKTPPHSSTPPPPASSPPYPPPASSPAPPPPGTGSPPPPSSVPGTAPPQSSTPPQSPPPESQPPPSSAPPESQPPVSSSPPESQPPASSLPPIRNSTITPPKSESTPNSPQSPPASQPPVSSSPPESPPASTPAVPSSPPGSAPPSQTKPNSPQTPPYQTTSKPGSPQTPPAPPGTTVPVVKTEIVYTTVTTCPYTKTHTSSGSVSIETGTTTSTVTLTRTETVCTKCVQPPQTSSPAPPTQPNSPQQPEQPKTPEQPGQPETPKSPEQPQKPPTPAPAPGLLPSCLQTWMTVTKCKSVTDTDCFCKDSDFTKKVQDCVSSWSQHGDELAGAMKYLAGICAKQIPQNPGLVTNVPSTITLAPVPATSAPNSPVEQQQPGQSAPANSPASPTPAPEAAQPGSPQGSPATPPVQIVHLDTQVTVTVPCPSGASAAAAPVTQIADGQVQAPAPSVCTTTSHLSKDVAVPQVAFVNNNSAGVGLVEGPTPTPTGAASPAETTPPAGAAPIGTGAPITPTTPATVAPYTGSDATKTRSSAVMLSVVLVAVGLAVFA